jgi:hypothetical protein
MTAMAQRSPGRLAVAAMLLVWVLPLSTAAGQAYCALRDPVRVLYEVYPEADKHRSLIRTITTADRFEIAQALPFTLLYDELGRHTLYITVRAGRPLGLLHVRSERGRYGLTEIAWALDLDARITGGLLQRCRDPELRAALGGQLLRRLSGADVADVLSLLAEEHWTAEERVLLRSAAKTAAVTQIVWNRDLLPVRALARANMAWPDAEPVVLEHPVVRATLLADTALEPASVQAWAAQAKDGTRLGFLVRSWVRFDGQRVEVWWQIDPDGRMASVHMLEDVDPSIQAAFAEVVGKSRTTVAGCDSAAGVVAGEILRAIRMEE